MKHIPKSQAKKMDLGAGDVLEYNLGDKDIDIAVATINGNYPKQGFAVNEEVKELLYVLSGQGTFTTKNETAELQAGDQIFINKGELFCYKDAKDLVVVAACAPAWWPDQHKVVKS